MEHFIYSTHQSEITILLRASLYQCICSSLLNVLRIPSLSLSSAVNVCKGVCNMMLSSTYYKQNTSLLHTHANKNILQPLSQTHIYLDSFIFTYTLPQVSHDPSEINVICRFAAEETFLKEVVQDFGHRASFPS